MLNKRPELAVFHFSGLAAVVVCAVLADQSRQDLPPDFTIFLGLCGAGFVLSALGAGAVWRAGGEIDVKAVLLWCVALRLVAIWGEPIYEDDYFRYLWDGRQTVETGTPYASVPSDFFLAETDDQWSDILDQINNPDIGTIYGPINQYVFALAYLIAPGSVFVLQVLLAAADVLLLVLLAQLLKDLGRRTLAPLVLYGFSPLILKEFAMTAHPDVLTLTALAASLLVWRRGKLGATAVLLGVAVAAKVFAFVVAPLLLRWRWRGWLIFAATVLVLHLPLSGRFGGSAGLSAMAGEWLFNAPLYYLLLDRLEPWVLKTALFLLFAGFSATYFFVSSYHQTTPPTPPRGDWLYLAMLLAAPVFNPWYYPLVLVFAVIYPTVWAWLGSFTVLLAYATGLQLLQPGLQPYEQPAWALWLEFAPLLAALLTPIVWARIKRG
ncbi:MAG: hypothetical protein AAGA23_09520 [Pseudomonadota bacterium]